MSKRQLIIIVLSLVGFGVIMRLMPHMPNATPVTALAFVGSLYLGRKWAITLPLAVMLVADIFIGFYAWPIMLSVYGSFAFIGLWSWISRKYKKPLHLGGAVAGSSLMFFFITNGAVWAFSPWYEKSFTGLLFAYEMGLPFLRNMLVGDLVYTFSLVAAFELAYRYGPAMHRFVLGHKQVVA